MSNSKLTMNVPLSRLAATLALAVLLTGCGLLSPKRRVAVSQVLTPLVEADTSALFAEVNRLAGVRSLRGKIDIQFLDTSFAECGVIDKYRTTEGSIIVQRPGQIYLSILAPFGIKVAEMSSNGQRFWAALYLGDEKYRRFVGGTNSAVYEKLEASGAAPDCRGGGKKQEAAMQRATVSALSSLRPQHFSDALLVLPISTENSNLLYAQSETFEEELDTRPNAKRGARVVRGYYILSELEPQGPNRARALRRFWFDRVGAVRLARVQTYNERGQLLTDVIYGNPKSFGADGRYQLPSQVELTRPQDRYSIRIAFQDSESVDVDRAYDDPEIFVLKNDSKLPEVDLDAKKK
ncbi:MAG: hypothetical protein LC802_16410 [Acidobacteria bacterium]|nr:hypothetical protein [Acidobacteriota bacterium]